MPEKWNLFGPLRQAKKNIAAGRRRDEDLSIRKSHLKISVDRFANEQADFDRRNDPNTLANRRKKAEDELALAKRKKELEFMEGVNTIYKNRTGDSPVHKYHDFVSYGRETNKQEYVEFATKKAKEHVQFLVNNKQPELAAEYANKTFASYMPFGPHHKWSAKDKDFNYTINVDGNEVSVPRAIYEEEVVKIDPDAPNKGKLLYDNLMARLHVPTEGKFIVPTKSKSDATGEGHGYMRKANIIGLNTAIRNLANAEEDSWGSDEKETALKRINEFIRKIRIIDGEKVPPQGQELSTWTAFKNAIRGTSLDVYDIGEQVLTRLKEQKSVPNNPKIDTAPKPTIRLKYDETTKKYWKRDDTGKHEISKAEYDKILKGE